MRRSHSGTPVAALAGEQPLEPALDSGRKRRRRAAASGIAGAVGTFPRAPDPDWLGFALGGRMTSAAR